MGDLPWIEVIYWGSAIIGGTLFVLRTILLFAGIGADTDHVDFHADDVGDFDVDGDSGGMNFSFSLLSLQGLTAFFTMFGLIGLTLLKAGVHVLLTIVGGTVAGLFTVFVISLIFAQVGRFQSEGNLNIQNAIGQTGTVYLRVPEDGSGQVQVSRQVEAISNLKIDKITVWDSGGGNGANSSTSNFIANLFKSLPPLQDISEMAGFELPEYLGKVKGENGDAAVETARETPPSEE